MKSLEQYSSSELKAALDIVEKREEEENIKTRERKNELVSKNTEILLGLVSDHKNKNCSDDSVLSPSHGPDFCVRCELLKTRKTGYLPNDLEVVLSLVYHYCP
jgi:FixJ family two-component response regulator